MLVNDDLIKSAVAVGRSERDAERAEFGARKRRRLSKGRSSRSHKGQRPKGGEERRGGEGEALRQCVIGVTPRGQQKELA